ncbi:LAETG motif-containing sortase-dependent surface protein [Streptomyces sp. NPDC026206]|uniref:LAETG motif-containing sortase-dependent surface protein n=1 Tax=Streptomyces sp. NPDC026206 TaxID=3157089 RepID=UPI0033CB944E
MKLRRALATAAAMTVVGPVALLAAPAAHAVTEPTASVSPSGPTSGTGSKDQDGAKDVPAVPGDTKKDDAKNAEKVGAAPTPEKSGSVKPSASPSPTYTRPAFCMPIFGEDRGKTGLRGLPGKIVAGSGWHEFTYRVVNVSKIKVMETDISLSLGSADPKVNDVAELSVTVEWYNPATGKWKPIEGEGAKFQDNDDFATVKSLKPGEYADARMRIKIGEKAKAGSGYFFTIGHSYGEDGQCGFDEISQFDFTVLSPGSKPGKVDDAKGKPGKPGRTENGGKAGQGAGVGQAGNKPSAKGELAELPVTGSLAETGSSSSALLIAGIGGAAVVVGAGALFVVRRRKSNVAA